MCNTISRVVRVVRSSEVQVPNASKQTVCLEHMATQYGNNNTRYFDSVDLPLMGRSHCWTGIQQDTLPPDLATLQLAGRSMNKNNHVETTE